MMSDLNSIHDFLIQKNIALAGVSRTKHKFGNTIFQELEKKGYNLYPVNPYLEEYKGKKCYKSIAELPREVTGIIINTKSDVTRKLIKESENKGIKHIWLQQGSADKDTLKNTVLPDSNVISSQCILMFAEPVRGFHGFHRWMKKTFGKLPD